MHVHARTYVHTYIHTPQTKVDRAGLLKSFFFQMLGHIIALLQNFIGARQSLELQNLLPYENTWVPCRYNTCLILLSGRWMSCSITLCGHRQKRGRDPDALFFHSAILLQECKQAHPGAAAIRQGRRPAHSGQGQRELSHGPGSPSWATLS